MLRITGDGVIFREIKQPAIVVFSTGRRVAPTPHAAVLYSKCRSSIYKVSENVSVPLPMLVTGHMASTFVVLHCSVKVIVHLLNLSQA